MSEGIDTRVDWRWLAETYWFVEVPDLPALQLAADGETLEWVVDQTVWQISAYANGYVWGTTAIVIREPGDAAPIALRSDPRITHMRMLGTVTPSGQVQLTFVPTSGSLEPTTGVGQMVERSGHWVFEMQMSTNRMGKRLLHWANMVQTRPGDPSWDSLPGVELSVPAMLEGTEPPSFPDDA